LSRSKTAPRRVPLTRERIETTALDLIEDEGLATFSTRKLAQALGCEAMSIYHHFPSKAHLMDALLDRQIASMPPLSGGTWIERLRIGAHDIREMALKRPEFFQFMALHRMNTPTALRWLDGWIATFREAGLKDEAAARLFRSLSYYVIGAALDETAGFAKGPSAAVPVEDAAVARDYPNVAAVGPYFKPAHHRKIFDTGLETLLDGVAKEAKRAAMR
jgi:AcrR family transcriptional regulator